MKSARDDGPAMLAGWGLHSRHPMLQRSGRMDRRETRAQIPATLQSCKRMLRLLTIVACLALATAPPGSAGERTLLPANHGPVVVVLDASGSMAASLGEETRLDAARRILLDTLALFPADRPVALVAYGHRRKSDCRDIETLRTLEPVDTAAIRAALLPLRARGKTPLSGALRHAAKLLPKGGGTIMLVSDGLETCKEDPCAVATTLREASAALVINVVGFGLAKGEMKDLACIAKEGGGQAIETSNAKDLKQALQALTDEQGPQHPTPADKSPVKPEEKPADPPPPAPKPVLLRAMVGSQPVPGAILFSVSTMNGETVYSGKGTEVTPQLLPGRYAVNLAAGNVKAQKQLTVTGANHEHHELRLEAGLARFSLVAAKGLPIADTDVKGNPAWQLVTKDAQAAAALDAIIAPEALLSPGRYEVNVAIGEFNAVTAFDVAAGKVVEVVADLHLGKIALEAALPGMKTVLDSGEGLSWTLAGKAGVPDRKAEATPRPTFLVPAGTYAARLTIAGAVIEKMVQVEAGTTRTVRLDLPSSELVLEGNLGPDGPAFTDWRDASWTVRPVALIGNAKAGPALENKAEASPKLTLLPGEWEVTLISGQATATQTLSLAPGATVRQRMSLAAGRLSISAAPAAGAPPLNVLLSVFAIKSDGSQAEKPIVEVGTSRDFSFVLPEGRYRIAASDDTGRKGTADSDIVAGQSFYIGITLK